MSCIVTCSFNFETDTDDYVIVLPNVRPLIIYRCCSVAKGVARTTRTVQLECSRSSSIYSIKLSLHLYREMYSIDHDGMEF